MLTTTKKETKLARSTRRRETSLKRSIVLTNNGLSLIFLLSTITLMAPYFTEIKEIALSPRIHLFLNYPLIILGAFDLLMCIYTYFGDRKLYSILRGRAALSLGFGAYLGWALDDVNTLIASVSFGLGILWAALAKRFSSSVLAVALGLGGSAFLAYLSLSGHFSELFKNVFFEFFTD